MVLGNINHFLERLEQFQIARGASGDRLIPVEFTVFQDPNMIFDFITGAV